MAELAVELVPRTCWYSNVRSNVSAREWNLCKEFVRNRSGERCEICGGVGRRWPVECHEVWEFEERREEIVELGVSTPVGSYVQRIQRLEGLIALCPACHEVKHIGRAEVIGRYNPARAHLARVNGWTIDQAERHIREAFAIWLHRSHFEWELDISYLTEVLGP